MACRIIQYGLAVFLLVTVMGCGVKTPPVESKSLSPSAAVVNAALLPQGVELRIQLPSRDKPDQAIDRVLVYYAYIPLAGMKDCPPCPPVLKESRAFDLTDRANKLDGGNFVYLDQDAPMDMQAAYQVVLVDAAGRVSPRSNYVRIPRVMPPARVKQLKATFDGPVIALEWSEVTTLMDGSAPSHKIGYLVQRRGPAGDVDLNKRLIMETSIKDGTILPGQNYAYRVAAAREEGGHPAPGEFSDWVEPSDFEVVALVAPEDLVGASLQDGLYLRFAPSVTPDIKGYIIERRDKADGSWIPLTAEPITENTYIDRNAELNQTYWYRVFTVDNQGKQSAPGAAMRIVHQP